MLSDSRSADQALVLGHVAQVLHNRTSDTEDVDARMLIKVLVLGGDEGLNQQRRHSVNGDEDALLSGELREQAAVTRMYTRQGRRIVVGELGVRRQIPAITVDGIARHATRENHAEQPEAKQNTDCAQHRFPPAATR